MPHKITSECTACGSCVAECPVDCISEGDIYVIDADGCTDCGACAAVCPVDAIIVE
jgi:ferredoxin